MTGLVRRTGRSVRLVRTIIEGSVLLSGFLLGGTLGLGTVAYMLLIGPLIKAMLPWFDPHARVSKATPSPSVDRAPYGRTTPGSSSGRREESRTYHGAHGPGTSLPLPA